ncbi:MULTISPECIES: AzlD family protein [unclassified Roseitalea]|uniref:AzlD family protein n=1 Tax=unclassified Roseitalea TaxID=2639107 RepID=UPI00273FDF03|nr:MULTISPECIES: AzlD family protein [unclassified Roseitalea]
MDPTTLTIIAFGAVATYLTRIGGHVVLSRFSSIPPRVEAALEAVPAAVLAAIVAPYFVYEGLAESLTLVVAALLALRVPAIPLLVIGWAMVMALRQVL